MALLEIKSVYMLGSPGRVVYGIDMTWVRSGRVVIVTGVGLTNIIVTEYFLGRF